MNKISEAKGRHKSRPRAVVSSPRRNRQSAEIKLAELRRRLLEISDLSAARALLSWDHATYMPKSGATARARQGAIVSRLAHESSVAPELGKLQRNLSHTLRAYPTIPTREASYALQDATSRRQSKCPRTLWPASARSGLLPTTPGNERGPRTTSLPWSRFWKGPSILVASTQTSSLPMVMAPP